MIDFSQIAENVQDFLSERKKAVLVSAILVLFFLVALVVMAFVPSAKKATLRLMRARLLSPTKNFFCRKILPCRKAIL